MNNKTKAKLHVVAYDIGAPYLFLGYISTFSGKHNFDDDRKLCKRKKNLMICLINNLDNPLV